LSEIQGAVPILDSLDPLVKGTVGSPPSQQRQQCGLALVEVADNE